MDQFGRTTLVQWVRHAAKLLGFALLCSPALAWAAAISGASVFGNYEVSRAGEQLESYANNDSHSAPDFATAGIAPGPPVIGSEFRTFTGHSSATPTTVGAQVTLGLSTHLQDTVFQLYSEADASRLVDDLIFSGPPGATSVVVSTPLFVAGLLSGDSDIPSWGCCAQIAAQMLLDGRVVAAVSAATNSAGSASLPPGVQSDYSVVGNRTVRSVHGNFTSTPIEVPLDVPISLRLTVGVIDSISVRTPPFNLPSEGAWIDLIGDFGDTFGFASPAHLFNLPAGYTANSASGGIVDNASASHGVPEPGMLALLALWLVGVCWRRSGHART